MYSARARTSPEQYGGISSLLLFLSALFLDLVPKELFYEGVLPDFEGGHDFSAVGFRGGGGAMDNSLQSSTRHA